MDHIDGIFAFRSADHNVQEELTTYYLKSVVLQGASVKYFQLHVYMLRMERNLLLLTEKEIEKIELIT